MHNIHVYTYIPQITCCHPVCQLAFFLRSPGDRIKVGGAPIEYKMRRRRLSCYPTKGNINDRCIHLLKISSWMIVLFCTEPVIQGQLKLELINSLRAADNRFSSNQNGNASPTLCMRPFEMSTASVVKVVKQALHLFPQTHMFAGTTDHSYDEARFN